MPTLHGTLLKAAGLLLALTTAVAAQDYPTKPVRLIIPFPPGGSNDVVGRLIATHLSERLGKQVVVDNRGAAPAAWSAPRSPRTRPHDGYTLLHHLARARGQSVALQAALRPDQVVHAGRHPRLRPERAGGQSRTCRCNSVKELLALAKEKPGQLQYASAGIGSFQHLGGELFKLDGRRQPPARAVQGRRPGHDRRDRRPHQGDVQLAGADHAAHPLRQAARARHRRHRRATRCCPTCRRSPRPACRATRRSTGGASWRRPARPPPIVEKLHKEITAVQDSDEVQKQFASEGAAGRADELGRVRSLHREGNEQMGARREGGRHQGGVMQAA